MEIKHPQIIQGGMGIGVSNWKLAREVSLTGQLGVVSGTAMNSILIRRLQDGDPGGHMRRALAAFPFKEVSEKLISNYFIDGGRPKDKPYKRNAMFQMPPSKDFLQQNVAACFVEVWLAKEGHNGLVGINLLEKIQLPNLSALYGAMLAGVDYVIMGAGIPREIPGALDLMSQHQAAKIKIPVEGSDEDYIYEFNPKNIFALDNFDILKRPYFFPIVSSATLALNLKRKATGRIDGFVVEGPLAGGHNAPPRGQLSLNERGEPVYGPRDVVELSDMSEIGLPFWMAGYYATPEKLSEVKTKGAVGIQVGTLFAFCEESGVDPEFRIKALKEVRDNPPPEGGWIFTDIRSSPTGFPFKASLLSGSIGKPEVYEKRPRICDLGYLRHAYQKPEGGLGLRCPAEPVKDYLKKLGKEEDTIGRKCLCNALFADVGYAQIQSDGYLELPLLTAGDDLNNIQRMFKGDSVIFSAKDVVNYLLNQK